MSIKEAILNAQYEAARGVNSIQLMLYYGIGRYLSHNTRQGKWGTDAIGTISRMLKADMPGLRGYSESNLKRMRTFYEEWRDLDADGLEIISSIKTDDLTSDNNSPIKTGEIHPAESTSINILSFNFSAIDAFPANDFRCIGFTHHSEILAKCKSHCCSFFHNVMKKLLIPNYLLPLSRLNRSIRVGGSRHIGFRALNVYRSPWT